MTMLVKTLGVSILLVLGPLLGRTQSTCPNSDFSQNNFNGWIAFRGNYNNPMMYSGVFPGRHTILTNQESDPNTSGSLMVIPPGATVSARLGQWSTGAEAEKLRYQITVSPDNAVFLYKYAVVFEDQGHSSFEQPQFSAQVLNQNGNPVFGDCAVYTVYPGQPGQTFQVYYDTVGSPRKWLPWSTAALDLSPYMGQTVYVEFTTKDCAQGNHFGYAYISCECRPLLLDVDYCLGSNATFTAPEGFKDYYWPQTGETTRTITVNNPAMGATYSCTMTTYTNQGNCSLTINAQMTPTIVTAGFSASNNCVNSPVQFTDTSTVLDGNGVLSGATSWEWDFGDGQVSALQHPQHTYASPGPYAVRLIAISSAGCRDTVYNQVDVTAGPSVQFALSNECVADTAYFINQTSSAVGLSFSWNFGDASVPETIEHPFHVYANAGQYTVRLTVTDAQGCNGSLDQPITIYAPPLIYAGPDAAVCASTSVTLNGSGGSSYVWDHGITDNVPFSTTVTTLYHVVGTNINGCKNSDSVLVTVYPAPIVHAGLDQEVCSGTSVTFSGSGVGLSYSWSDGIVDNQSFVPAVGNYRFVVTGTDGNGCMDIDTVGLIVHANPVVSAGTDQIICAGSQTSVSGSGATAYTWDNGITNGITFVPASTTTYMVTGTDQNGCQGTDQVTVAIEPAVNVGFSAPVTSGCNPLQVNFTNLSTGTPGASCFWNFGDNSSGVGCGDVNHTYTAPGCYDVELTVITANGCTWSKVMPDYICVHPNPVASFVPVPSVITEIDLSTQMNNSSTGAVSYSWDFGDGFTSNEEEPDHLYSSTPIQDHIVQLIAYSDHGCRDTAEAIITMKPVLLFYVPNTFTPDDNSFNQTFQPVFTSGYDLNSFNMLIFDRWGEVVFETKSPALGWDGTYDGKNAPEGVYTWKIVFKTAFNDERKEVEGHITLLR